MVLKRFFSLFVLLFIFSSLTYATHNRAGEMYLTYIGPPPALYYKGTIITYTKTSSSAADRPTLDSVYWGDGSPRAVFVRIQKIDLGNDISKNIYEGYHTYSGNGTFIFHFEDPNRNADVINIPNSVEVPFYVETALIINPFQGQPNSTPVLTYPPIDQGCLNRIFIHNPGAFDPDGDSLSYELTVCRGANGDPIPGYTFPTASNTFDINPVTGDLTWDSPIQEGEYNVAFRINEWRNGSLIGYVTRDMQILIGSCANHPPDFFPIADTCVVAGDTLNFDVTAYDPDGNSVILTASGGPFVVANPATFTPVQLNNDTVISHFSWPTTCANVRTQPYYAQFKAQDTDTTRLVNLKSVMIRVIGLPPVNPNAVANGNIVDLTWSPPGCIGATGYRIYRRTGMYNGTIECPCDNGAPAYAGYSLIGTNSSINDTTFSDNNNGAGLSTGVQYCYLVTAVYPGGSESCATPQTCVTLKKDLPVLTNADVRTTDLLTGSVYVAWSKPTDLDTIQDPPPYQYRLYHSQDGVSFNQVAVFNDLNDTIYIDTLVNTVNFQWTYKVELYYTQNSSLVLKGSSTKASSVFLTLAPSDNRMVLSWTENVPWLNEYYEVYKKDVVSGLYNLLDTTSLQTYTDTGLVNGNTYCYYIRSIGLYSFPGYVDPILNRSQRVCGSPLDNVNPCNPNLTVQSFCSDNLNRLEWTNPNLSCADDVLKYYIYYAPSQSSTFERIDSIVVPTDTIYLHKNLSILAGCYKVTAVDSVGNESLNPLAVCVDTCRQYVLPSVFTPNNDNNNDLFHPCDSTTSSELQAKNCPPYKNVKDVEMKIYNRWGTLVFETNDKDINWDGKSKDSKTDCPEGVYYYTCRVNFYRVSGVESIQLNGYIHLIRGN